MIVRAISEILGKNAMAILQEVVLGFGVAQASSPLGLGCVHMYRYIILIDAHS